MNRDPSVRDSWEVQCILCGHRYAEDVTPEDTFTSERQFECPHCRRRFAVKSTTLVNPEKPTR